MLTTLLLALTIAADPAQKSELDITWEQVQLGSEKLVLAIELRPTIAEAQRQMVVEAEARENEVLESLDLDGLVDDVTIDDESVAAPTE